MSKTNNSTDYSTTILKIPNSIYSANPEKAIVSILGNDIKIISHEPVNIITNNDEQFINVKYSCIDINPFVIYKIDDIKRCNTHSSFHVCKINNTFVLLTSKPDKLPCYIRINIIKTKKFQLSNDTDIYISYHGTIIKNKTGIFNNFTNLFEIPKLTIHGFNLYGSIKDVNVPFNEKFKEIVKNNPFDIQTEKTIFKNFDMFDISGINKYISLNSFKNIDIKNIPNDVIINCESLTPVDIIKQFADKHGIIYLSNKRNSPFVFYLVPDEFYTITKEFLKHLIYILVKDAENLTIFTK
jgi:hypothetical protein